MELLPARDTVQMWIIFFPVCKEAFQKLILLICQHIFCEESCTLWSNRENVSTVQNCDSVVINKWKDETMYFIILSCILRPVNHLSLILLGYSDHCKGIKMDFYSYKMFSSKFLDYCNKVYVCSTIFKRFNNVKKIMFNLMCLSMAFILF